ncbi:MAG: FliH/SctL family protein [Bdellovibrionota bacterium]
MEKFKKEIIEENSLRVIKVAPQKSPAVQQFDFTKLNDPSDALKKDSLRRQAMKTVVPTRSTSQFDTKNLRFKPSDLLRDPLAIEEEERRLIEERVRAGVDSLAAVAKKTAAEAGYQEGLCKGHEEAFQRFKREADERLSKLSTLINELEGAKEQIFHANEQFLIELIYRIARMVLLRELKADRGYVVRLAKMLIERVGARENITVRISQEDLDTIELLKDGLAKNFADIKNINIEASTQVKGGGCMLETEWNAIDASVETQLQGIYNSLTGSAGGSGT